MAKPHYYGSIIVLCMMSLCMAFLSCGDDHHGSDTPSAPGDDDEPVCNESHPDWTVGLQFCTPKSFIGYTLFAPTMYHETYLIDNFGRAVHTWQSDYLPGLAAYLLENGDLLRSVNNGRNPVFTGGGSGGGVEIMDWDGHLVWTFKYNTQEHRLHHDVKMLPSGNILMIAWELKSAAEAMAAGRRSDLIFDDQLWLDHLIEVKPVGSDSGEIVWEWHLWDHLVQDFDPTANNFGLVADHPELVNLNYVTRGTSDWTHINSVNYNERLDQIILSSRFLSEIWVIDHGTTTEQAAGHSGGKYGKGGDILFRWGNPEVYDSGNDGQQMFFGQHDAQWIPEGLPGAGNMMVFNNGDVRHYSSVDEFTPPVDDAGVYAFTAGQPGSPDDLVWSYVAQKPASLFSLTMSGAHRLQNGNTLLCSADQGAIIEVTPEKEVVWEYINPVTYAGPVNQGNTLLLMDKGMPNRMFNAIRYAPDYAGLAGRELTGEDYVEGN